jgi:uncharacterized protein YndB with AHSA1/START domain
MTAASDNRAVVTLVGETALQFTREFDAPRHLVYRAWSTPELVAQWWHANRGEITSIEIDLRAGGQWRYAMIAASGGFEVAFHGEYLEVVPNERIVATEIFEGMPDAHATTTATFDERDGRTLLTVLVEHSTRASRDAHIASGMEDGLQDALGLLETVAAAAG